MRLARIGAALTAGTLRPLDTADHRVGPPLANIGKIVCVGPNYADHAAETGATLPTEPAGVALGRTTGGYLRAGDTMRLQIDRLGAQQQHLGGA